MNIELSKTSGNGTAIHSIQSIKITTSKNTTNPFYGIHTVLTAGSSRNPDFTSYDFLTKGAGISFGVESSNSIFNFMGENTSVVFQVDASLINNKITDIRKGFVKSWRYKGIISKAAIVIFCIVFVTLTYLGTKSTTEGRTLVAQICTLLYFSFFLLMPFYTRWEKTKPVPERVTG